MGPSVRIKRGSYSQIRDSDARQSTAPRTLADIFSPGQAQPPQQPSPPVVSSPSEFSQRSSQHSERLSPTRPRPTTADRSASPPQARRSRLRSGSIVSDHVLNNQGSVRVLRERPSVRREPQRGSSPLSHGSHRSGEQDIPQHLVTLEGPQADVVIEAGPQSGRVGSALSLEHSYHDDMEDSDDENENGHDHEHHHDDIVEHLDVIDPQVFTVSTLTNTANSILIPPLSIYSRRPVVNLASARSPDAGEKGVHYKDALDRHVDDCLKRPSKIRRTLQGVWSFLKTPMGIVMGIYGFLVVFWGAAIVIFLIKIIDLHNSNDQGFWVEISSQVENGLFTIIGVGLIPWRLLDSHRIIKIWHYKRRTIKLRKEAGLPQLYDVNDLPDPFYDPGYVHVLSDAEQADLRRQQRRFQNSQTWYRPHGTATHKAFPINTALLICLCNDGNSVFQIILCSCMWSLNRFMRPAWTTGSLIPLSFLCGIGAGVLIWRGGERTKRTKEVAERLSKALATEHPDLSELRDEIIGTTYPPGSRHDKPSDSASPSEQEQEQSPTPAATASLGTASGTRTAAASKERLVGRIDGLPAQS